MVRAETDQFYSITDSSFFSKICSTFLGKKDVMRQVSETGQGHDQ
jgi:hypothetical protein